MFQFQQLPLFVNAPGVSGQAAVCADHTVTGNDDGYLIMTHRTADRLRRHPGKLLLFSKLPCDLAVGRSPSVGNLQRISHTDCRNAVPTGCSGGRKSGWLPAK